MASTTQPDHNLGVLTHAILTLGVPTQNIITLSNLIMCKDDLVNSIIGSITLGNPIVTVGNLLLTTKEKHLW